MRALKSQRSTEQIDLPYFHPEENESRKWVNQVEQIKIELGWSDVQILARVGRFLSNDAKRWFDRWNPENRNWVTFRKDFLESFPTRRNLGRLLEEASNFNSSYVNT